MTELRRVCVYCGSSTGASPAFADAARALGRTLAHEGIGLVYGGGAVGLMGVIADAVLAEGGHVTGVIPRGLFRREVAHRGVSELREVGSMHERKQVMFDLADGFAALPGGLGTLEEVAEVATWAQLGIHRKPVVLLDVDGFFEPLVAWLDGAVAAGLLRPGNRSLIQHTTDPGEALARLRDPGTPPVTERWITPEER